jgi:predicted patatin/cPLA2 family phospholipase
MEVLERRREIKSVPGQRDDDARVALAVEGGGMRGVVSAGMLIALADLGFANGFDAIYGSSAGAVNAAYLFQGERWGALSLYYSDLSSKDFVDRRRVFRGGPIVDFLFLREQVLTQRRPINLELIERSGVHLFVAVTNVDDRKTELLSEFSSSRDLVECLVAGAWLPILAGPPVVFRGHRCLDGGVLLEHPSTAAIRSGCSHVLVLSTRYPNAPGRPELWRRVLRRYLNFLESGLGEDYWHHTLATRNHRIQLSQHIQGDGSSKAILNIAPRPAWKAIDRLEQDTGLLLSAAKEGYEAAIECLTGRAARTVYAISRLETEPGEGG